MDLFICTNTYIPLRKGPSHRSEMVSQVLFGERFAITDRLPDWVKIETLFDAYSGWINSLHGGYAAWDEGSIGIITANEIRCIKKDDGSLMTIYPGSELFGITDDLSSFTFARQTCHLEGSQIPMLKPDSSITSSALQFLNSPYLYGGRTPAGIDCSGLVQAVFKIHGTALPRDAAKQAELGDTVNFLSDARPGDVLFFSRNNDEISHTGILVDNETVIHAYGMVRADRIDHHGIWSEEKASYTHMLRLIKRMK